MLHSTCPHPNPRTTASKRSLQLDCSMSRATSANVSFLVLSDRSPSMPPAQGLRCRPICVALLAFLLCGGPVACGDSRGKTATGHAAGPSAETRTADARQAGTSDFSTHHNDRDNDGDHNNDDEGVLGYGHAANAADREQAAALLNRYIAASAAENGAVACRLLVPFIAESAAENLGHSRGLRGSTCPVVMTKLFERNHRLLVKKHASLHVMNVRVEGDKALVILNYSAIPEVRQIAVRRVGSGWRVLEFLDGILE